MPSDLMLRTATPAGVQPSLNFGTLDCAERVCHGAANTLHILLCELIRGRKAHQTTIEALCVWARDGKGGLEDRHAVQGEESWPNLDVRVQFHQLHAHFLARHTHWQKHCVQPPDRFVPRCNLLK